MERDENEVAVEESGVAYVESRSGSPIVNGLKGLFIGMANVIPGVSGGTIAAITGLYDDLVSAFGEFFKTGWKRNTRYLAPVVLGVMAGFLFLARFIDIALSEYPEITLLFFTGLIAGSVPYLIKRAGASTFRVRYLIPLVIAFVLLAWMGLAERPAATPPMTDVSVTTGLIVFGSAVVGSIAMVVPGLSGSFLFLLIGVYSTITRIAAEFNIPLLLVFVAGTAIGIVIASKIISWLLRNFHATSYYAIVGLVIGSLFGVWPGLPGGTGTVMGIVSLLVGLAISLTLGTDMKERLVKRK
ncbi:MAG: DUF368 domain-containing protein [Spirochaetaceae bacterium]|nr:MAG: DUF368 domain-containing protein [Spirochaetaceae bacterium]